MMEVKAVIRPNKLPALRSALLETPGFPGMIVTKVEGLVFGTNSSKSPKMAAYYAFWEKEVYNTITKMIMNNLTKFNESLANPSKALFQIETILAVPEIALHLSPNEMAKLFLQSVRDCIEA